MTERFKLGLTRNRLFALDNAVVFVGTCDFCFDERDCAKALKMLAIKEPVITGVAELAEDSSAYIVTGKHEPGFNFTEDEASDVKEHYDSIGIDFSEHLFEFSVCRGNTLVIAAHTAVCDSKSVLRLAMEFVNYYTHKSVSVEPSDLRTFPDVQSLPAKLNSPIIDKLSADIESKWKKKKESFTVADYKRASEKYSSEKPDIGFVKTVISAEDKVKLREYCSENNIDLSSVVAYGFYDVVYSSVNAAKKALKMSCYSDRRLFVSDTGNCRVGAFNGYVDVSVKVKDKKKSDEERMKALHVARYKGVTSAFRSFYDELLLMKLPQEYNDASYMSVAGLCSSASAKRLAENYGCCDSRIMAYFSCDAEQEYWSQLSFFKSISVHEPFVRRFYTMVEAIICEDEIRISFRYNKGEIDEKKALEIASEAMKKICSFAK